MTTGGFSVTLILCTRDRPASLTRTLESLASTDRSGIALDVIVVDNSTQETAAPIVERLSDRLPARVAREARVGKAAALNRGLIECGPTDVVAILDDDITVDARWLQGVRAITERWPDKGFFGGSIFAVLPDNVPSWARAHEFTSWAYSSEAVSQDRPVPPGHWVSGNCFWFRAGLLPPDYRFAETWLTEPPLMLDLAERGHGGVLAPDAIAWHHVQPELVDLKTLTTRAATVGRAFAAARLVPYRRSIKQAVLFSQHPVAGRLACWLNAARWQLAYWWAAVSLSEHSRIVGRLKAIERLAAYRQYLDSCRGVPEYAIRRPFNRA